MSYPVQSEGSRLFPKNYLQSRFVEAISKWFLIHFWTWKIDVLHPNDSRLDRKQLLAFLLLLLLLILLLLLLLLLWRYNYGRFLAISTITFHLRRSCYCSAHFTSFIFFRSFLTSSSHRDLGLPAGLSVNGFDLCILFTVLVSGIQFVCPNQLNRWGC